MIALRRQHVQVRTAVCQRCGACCSLVIGGELVACRHLIAGAGTYRCAIYATRPQVCRDYDCTREDINPIVAERSQAAMRAVTLVASNPQPGFASDR